MAKILVVDDDRELRENIAEVLTEAGFEVLKAESGEKALQLLGPAVDLVLLDLVMPGMGGMATLSLLKQHQPRLRVIMLTAFATVENAVEAMRRGADDYMTKPFKVGDLLMTVRKNLEEAKFQECHLALDMDQTFNCLSNPMRREILRCIGREGRIRFMDLARRLQIEDHTKMNFHLKLLREAGLVAQDERKLYTLTAEGRRVIGCMELLAHTLNPKV
ncbi:MAG: response regulator [Desulfuromonadales bacterium]|nr:response regulator [Desulfuromonadales bacterium]